MPARLKLTAFVDPASYRPRSNRLPSKSENTLWKKGSKLGNSTTEPTGTTRRCGVKRLFFCTSRKRWGDALGRRAPVALIPESGVSHRTAPELSVGLP